MGDVIQFPTKETCDKTVPHLILQCRSCEGHEWVVWKFGMVECADCSMTYTIKDLFED